MAMDMPMPRYEYEPLGTEWNTRLLEVFPGKEDEPIQCSLTRAILNSAPEYVALSYTWGDKKDHCLIFMNDLINIPSPSEDTSDGVQCSALGEWKYEARDIMGTLESYPRGCSVLDAYRRTLIANKTFEGLKPESEFGEAYKAAFRRPLAMKDEVEVTNHPPSLFRLLRFHDGKLIKPSSGGRYLHPQGRPFVAIMGPMIPQGRFGTTISDYMGLFPAKAKKKVCI